MAVQLPRARRRHSTGGFLKLALGEIACERTHGHSSWPPPPAGYRPRPLNAAAPSLYSGIFVALGTASTEDLFRRPVDPSLHDSVVVFPEG
jgi:hypothetical protein